MTAAGAFIEALGGAANLVDVDACTTRLRLVVADQNAVNVRCAEAPRRARHRAALANALQVVLGPIADQVAGEIRAGLHATARRHGAALRSSQRCRAQPAIRPCPEMRTGLLDARIRCVADGEDARRTGRPLRTSAMSRRPPSSRARASRIRQRRQRARAAGAGDCAASHDRQPVVVHLLIGPRRDAALRSADLASLSRLAKRSQRSPALNRAPRAGKTARHRHSQQHQRVRARRAARQLLGRRSPARPRAFGGHETHRAARAQPRDEAARAFHARPHAHGGGRALPAAFRALRGRARRDVRAGHERGRARSPGTCASRRPPP